MALVRKTETLKGEIKRNIQSFVDSDIVREVDNNNFERTVELFAHTAFENGMFIETDLLQAFKDLQAADTHNFIACKEEFKRGTIGVFSSSDKGEMNREYLDRDFDFTKSIEIPNLNTNQMFAQIRHKGVYFAIGYEHNTVTAFLGFSLDVISEDGNCFDHGYIPLNRFLYSYGAANRSRQDFTGAISVENLHERGLNELAMKIEGLATVRDKFQRSARRMAKVEDYVLDKLWKNCASLNGMAKIFPGVLEYCSDETLERFHKNTSRKSQTIDADMLPDSDILAATAKAKLK
jgi:hypothetical protein